MASRLNVTMYWKRCDNDYNCTVSNFSNPYDTRDDSLTSETIRQKVVFLKYYMWVFFGVGLPANILTIVTILKFHFGGPASFLLCYLAGIDHVSLLAKLIEINLLYANPLINSGSFFCKTIHLPSALFTAISNWTLIIICAERYVSICRPFERKIWISNKRCIVMMMLVSLSLTIIFAVLFLIFVDVDSRDTCVVIHIGRYLFRMFQFVIVIAIPFVLITVLTILVIRALYKARGQRQRMLINAEDGQCQNINERHDQYFVSYTKRMEQTLSRLMMSSAILYCVISGPYCIFTLVYLPFHDSNLVSISVIITVQELFFILMDASHLLNVFVYIVFVSGFRANVYKLFKSVFKCV